MANHEPPSPGRSTITVSWAAVLVVVALTLIAGIAVGRVLGGAVGAAALEPDATATRTAEVAEVNRLQTQVAQAGACTPVGSPVTIEPASPTSTPTPVPPAPMGQKIAYREDWTVAVTGFTPAAPSDRLKASGRFLQMTVIVANHRAVPRAFPFSDFVLVDKSGRTYAMNSAATVSLIGAGSFLTIDPAQEKEFAIIFDVAVDSGTDFVLESATDPTFRVAVKLQLLG
jgi:hypothetical protein